MKKNIITGLLLSSVLFSGYSFAQTSANNNLQTTAKLVASCTMIAENVNFGILTSPLVAQKSSSNMTVLCNNNASYKIDLAYGGVYGTGNPTSDYTVSYQNKSSFVHTYDVRNKSGAIIGTLSCGGTGGSAAGQVSFSTPALAQIFGASPYIWVSNATYKGCTTDATKPIGWTGLFDAAGQQTLGGAAYNYGVMTGAIKKNLVAYNISVPTDPNKVWNAGNNSHTATGTGVNQIIPVNGTIVPAKSSSLFPAEDFYLDTVTAVITF